MDRPPPSRPRSRVHWYGDDDAEASTSSAQQDSSTSSSSGATRSLGNPRNLPPIRTDRSPASMSIQPSLSSAGPTSSIAAATPSSRTPAQSRSGLKPSRNNNHGSSSRGKFFILGDVEEGDESTRALDLDQATLLSVDTFDSSPPIPALGAEDRSPFADPAPSSASPSPSIALRPASVDGPPTILRLPPAESPFHDSVQFPSTSDSKRAEPSGTASAVQSARSSPVVGPRNLLLGDAENDLSIIPLDDIGKGPKDDVLRDVKRATLPSPTSPTAFDATASDAEKRSRSNSVPSDVNRPKVRFLNLPRGLSIKSFHRLMHGRGSDYDAAKAESSQPASETVSANSSPPDTPGLVPPGRAADGPQDERHEDLDLADFERRALEAEAEVDRVGVERLQRKSKHSKSAFTGGDGVLSSLLKLYGQSSSAQGALSPGLVLGAPGYGGMVTPPLPIDRRKSQRPSSIVSNAFSNLRPSLAGLRSRSAEGDSVTTLGKLAQKRERERLAKYPLPSNRGGNTPSLRRVDSTGGLLSNTTTPTSTPPIPEGGTSSGDYFNDDPNASSAETPNRERARRPMSAVLPLGNRGRTSEDAGGEGTATAIGRKGLHKKTPSMTDLSDITAKGARSIVHTAAGMAENAEHAGAKVAHIASHSLKNSRHSSTPSLSALIAATGNISGPATPSASSVGPAPKRPGYKLSRYSYGDTATQRASRLGLPRTSVDTGAGEEERRHARVGSLSPSQSVANLAHAATRALHPTSTKDSFASATPTLIAEGASSGLRDHRSPLAHKGSSHFLWPMNKMFGLHAPSSVDLEKAGGYPSRSGANTPEEGSKSKSKKRQQEIFITMHIAAILQRHDFVIRLARALMMFGAPTHRIEAQLAATARVLELDAQFIYLPNVLLIAFGDQDTHTSSTHFVKQSSGGLDLGRLQEIHTVYRKVIHDKMHAAEGAEALKEVMKRKDPYPIWLTCVFGALCSFFVSGFAFSGSFIDMFMASALGACVVVLQMTLAARNPLFSNVFEISAAFLVSFASKGLSATGMFCYESVVAGGVVLILPGYIILCGALELASKSIVSGSVRLLYAIFYSLFLGFGLAIGSDVFGAIYPASLTSPTAQQAALSSSSAPVTIQGTFTPDNSTVNPFGGMGSGIFSFKNGTDTGLEAGNVVCFRDPSWPWYHQGVSRWFLFILIPMFALFLSLFNKQQLMSRQLPVMLVISCAGYAANFGVTQLLPNRSDIVSAVGSFVIGILGNLYSRFGRGSAFPSMATAVLVLVPSGIAVAGGLSMTTGSSSGESFSSGLQIGMRMVQVAIGITVGLFFSSLLVYPIPKMRGAIFSF